MQTVAAPWGKLSGAMNNKVTRRGFIQLSAAASLPVVTTAAAPARFHVPNRRRAVTPTAVGSANARKTLEKAIELMAKGVPPVDAAVAGHDRVVDDGDTARRGDDVQ